MIQIIDVIKHKNKYSTQTMIVIDKHPEFKYKRVGDMLIAEDSGFFSFYKYKKPSKNWEAFAGREFDIHLDSGEIEKAYGQWWDHLPEDYSDLVYCFGTQTEEGLARCNVFHSSKVDKVLVDEWLADNEPSNNYHKYDTKNKDYGEHKIISRWEAV